MIYLDNNATTPLDPLVLSKMQEQLNCFVGNPSSVHRYGQRAKNLVTRSQNEIADFFHVLPSEIIFTSGATEALNMAVLGLKHCPHIITSTLEHPALLAPIEKMGGEVSALSPEKGRGSITLEQVKAAWRPETRLIALMHANNETGVITEIEEIAAFAEERGILFLVDGVAFLGKDTLNIPRGVSALCFSGHKIHGPHGIGILIARKRHKLDPLILGGGQQNGRRSGTENVAAIVGFQVALQQISQEAIEAMRELRAHFERRLKQLFPQIVIHGEEEKRVSNTSNIYFPGCDGETLMMQLDLAGVAVGLGSACASGGLMLSKVLLNMGLPAHVARSSLRFSFSRFTTLEEIEKTIEILKTLYSTKSTFCSPSATVPSSRLSTSSIQELSL